MSRPSRPPPRPPARLPEAIAAARCVAVLGMGSELRGDDIAGVLVARRLAAWCQRTGHERLFAFVGASAPENFTGAIGRVRPEVVVVVDAAYLGRQPGEVEIAPLEQIGGSCLSTHTLPVPIIVDYLRKTIGCSTFVLGIQVAQTEVLARPSPEVARAVRRVVSAFQRAFPPPARVTTPCGPAGPACSAPAVRGAR